MKMLKLFIGSLLFAFLLSGCVSGKPKVDSYTSHDGTVTEIRNDREMCVHACNTDYNRCGDTSAAQRDIGADLPSSLGARAECRSELQSCLSSCKSL